jgi:hypothetical protein
MNTFASTDNPEMTLPLFHLNGNSPKTLGKEYFEALTALREFMEKFYNIEFHARDYYPLGDEAWLKARAQREAQKANIESLRHYLDAHSAHCFESARSF